MGSFVSCLLASILSDFGKFRQISFPSFQKDGRILRFSYPSSVVRHERFVSFQILCLQVDLKKKKKKISILSMSFDCKYPCDVTCWLLKMAECQISYFVVSEVCTGLGELL